MPDKSMLDRMDTFAASKFDNVKHFDGLIDLLIFLSRHLIARTNLVASFSQKAESVLTDLEQALAEGVSHVARFSGDYAEDVQALYGVYDFDYDTRTPNAKAV